MSYFYSTFIAIVSFLLILIHGSIFSYALSFSKSKIDKDRSWHISALTISYDNENKIYVAEGEVIITGIKQSEQYQEDMGQGKENIVQYQGIKKPYQKKIEQSQRDIRLEADYVQFSNITRDAVASGNVLLISGKDNVICDRLKLNLETEMGTIYNGVVFIEESNFYITGNTIEKNGKDTYLADKATVTSCDGENPDWKLSGKDIEITIDGYGTAKNATFWAGKIPALYSPIVLFPAKTKRQTGLLTPQFSSSDKKGFEVEQPLYFATSRSTDATIYGDYMSKRGIKTALEFRYVLSKDNFGTLFYDYLNDSKIDNISRISQDRYWFRMKNNHVFNDTWHTRLDIDCVSDSDYLHEFQYGFTGFDTISRYFSDTFGRSVDEYDDTTRENNFNINRTWTGATLNIGVQWFDNVDSRNTQIDYNNSDSGDTLQKLPFIEFNTVKKQLGKTPFYYDFGSGYRYFYRQNSCKDSYSIYSYNPNNKVYGEIADLEKIDNFIDIKPMLNGHRADISPKIYMPLQLGAFYLEPSTCVRQSLWYVDDFFETNINRVEKISHREMFDSNLELSTKLSRIFSIDKKAYKESDKENLTFLNHSKTDVQSRVPSLLKIGNNNSMNIGNSRNIKIKHELVPKIEYSFIENMNQDEDEFPYFDPLDYTEEKNCFTWSVGNRLTSRNRHNIYNEFAWIDIHQSYRIDLAKSNTLFKSDVIQKTNIFLNSNDLSSLNDILNSNKPFKADEFIDSNWINLSDLINMETYSFKSGKHFSDILTEIEFSPTSFFSVNSEFKWSPYNNRFTAHDSGFTIRDTRGDALQAFYRYQDSQLEYAFSQLGLLSSQHYQIFPSESLFTSVSTQLTENFSLFFILEHDLEDRKTIESHAGFYFNRPCWAMRFSYSDTPEDQSLSFMVNLNGIGEFGNR